MRPEFATLRDDIPSKKVTGAVLPELLGGEFTSIAIEEEGGFTGLIIEGVARVVENRKNDPAYLAAHPMVRNAIIYAIEARIGALQTKMDSSQAQSDELQGQMDALQADLLRLTGGASL